MAAKVSVFKGFRLDLDVAQDLSDYAKKVGIPEVAVVHLALRRLFESENKKQEGE